jgi:hypothetical protein
MGMSRDVHVEIDSIAVRAADMGDMDAIQAAVADRLEGTTDHAPAIAAAIARTITAEAADGR